MDRRELTRQMLEQLVSDQQHNWTLDQALINWWVGKDPAGRLQLSHIGNRIFASAVTAWQVDLGQVTLSPNRIRQLAQLTCPWHLRRSIGGHTVTLYGGREATVARLYSDPAQWLDSLG